MMAPWPFDRVWPLVPPRAAAMFPPDVVAEARRADACDEGACLVCGDGVIMVKTEPDDNGGRRMYVLVAVATGAPGAFKRREGELLELARRFRCTSVAFTTDRPRAWRRVLSPAWEFDGEEFSRRL